MSERFGCAECWADLQVTSLSPLIAEQYQYSDSGDFDWTEFDLSKGSAAQDEDA